jgi:hypothetical protein
MKIKLVILLMLILTSVSALSGCIGDNSIVGTYGGNYSDKNVTLTTYPDGTFTVLNTYPHPNEYMSGQETGVYKKEGDVYVFSTALQSFTAKTNKYGDLVDPETGSLILKRRK